MSQYKVNFRYQIYPVVLLLAVQIMYSCTNNDKKAEITVHPAIVSQEFIYEIENAPTPQCHASTIAESGNKLIAAWFGGSHEKNKDVGILVSQKSDSRWAPPREVVNGVQEDGSRYPCWNPVLFQPDQGPLMLFYKVGPDPDEWWGMLVTSSDGGTTWAEPKPLPADVLGPIKNKPVQLDNGTVLCPSSREKGGWRIHMEFTDRTAGTWKSSGPLNNSDKFGAIQPTILIYPGNKLQLLCRTSNAVISECWSDDGGQSWREMSATALPNPNSGIDAVSLKDGRQLLVYNPTGKNWGARVPLSIALSGDGKTWKKVLDLEPVTNPENVENEEYSYPGIIQTADGMVHIVYTYNRLTVKHVVVDPKRIG